MKTLSKVFTVLSIMVMALAMQSCGRITANSIAEELNKKCPINLGDGVELTSVTAEANNVVYLYSVELSEEYDVDDIISDESKPAAVQSLLQSAKTDKEAQELVDLCKTVDMNIIYRYKNLTTGNVKDLVIASSDLK